MDNSLKEKGYLGNSKLKRADSKIEWTPELLEEYKRCAEDPLYFAEKYIMIVHVDHGLIPMKLYDYQKEILQKITDNRRVSVLTSRQAGKTSCAVAVILHYILFNQHKTVGLLANKGDAAREILNRIQIAYEALPKWLQSGIVEWNKGSIELSNGCKVIAAATSSSAIRGKSCVTGDSRVCIEKEDKYYFIDINTIIHNSNEEGDDMCLYTVYLTTNKVNNKQYYGFHKIKSLNCIKTEFSETGSVYRNGYLGSGKLMKRALEKYGPQNMSQQLIFVTDDRDEALEMEAALANEAWCESESTYNIIVGGTNCVLYGEQNGFYGKNHTPETIEKIQATRNKTKSERRWSWSESINTETGKIYYCSQDLVEDFDIKDRWDVYNLVAEDKIRYTSNFLQSTAIINSAKRKAWVNGSAERQHHKAKLTSERFKGKPKSAEHRARIGMASKSWIEENPDLHRERMMKINKNPEKIKKTADKHRGMKRSDEARKNMSDAQKGKTANNKGQISIYNSQTGEAKFINKDLVVPEGWVAQGKPKKTRGTVWIHNNDTLSIKRHQRDEQVPLGWSLGRKP